jgi:hypothetical protein
MKIKFYVATKAQFVIRYTGKKQYLKHPELRYLFAITGINMSVEKHKTIMQAPYSYTCITYREFLQYLRKKKNENLSKSL